MPQDTLKSCLFSFTELETPIGRLHFGGFLPRSTGTGFSGYYHYAMYKGVLILNGERVYRDGNGQQFLLEPGCVMPLFPELAHHYGPKHGQRWNESFVAFSGRPSMPGGLMDWIRRIRLGICQTPKNKKKAQLLQFLRIQNNSGQDGRKSYRSVARASGFVRNGSFQLLHRLPALI